MNRILRIIAGGVVMLSLSACENNGKGFPNFQFTGRMPVLDNVFKEDPPVIR